MRKKIKIFILLIVIILLCVISFLLFSNNDEEIKSIKSDKQLSRIYNYDTITARDTFINIITMPFSLFTSNFYNHKIIMDNYSEFLDNIPTTDGLISSIENASSSSNESYISKDYSTTNIQVENVDEADITKTDGDYIYSISDSNVIITDVMNSQEIKIASTIKLSDGSIPEDLILYKNELVVISANSNINSNSYYRNNYKNNTIVRIYDITTKTNPKLIKSYELYEPYYTSRCINNVLYVISSGNLRKEDDIVIRSYKEDNNEKQIALEDIKYLKDIQTTKQTIISVVDLENAREDIDVSSYLIDISNAYVSENNIYLLNQKYNYNVDTPPIRELFGLKGVIGVFTYNDDNNSRGYNTEIYKFNITPEGKVIYDTRNNIQGKTINQYSLDENNGHLRIALYDSEGARVAIFDENLKQIGISEYVAKGETMYSSRFMNDKVYLVTYKTMDPLFVIDLSNEISPKVLGELHIPGYSTYLHPYDESHLIGIGMQTEEVVNKNSSGRVISTTSKIVGMKMALFDVTDVNNPVQ